MFYAWYYHDDRRASVHSGSDRSRTRWSDCTETITSPTVYSTLLDAGRRKGGKQPLMKHDDVQADSSHGSELLDVDHSQFSEMSDFDARLEWSKGLRAKLDELTAHKATHEGRFAARNIIILRRLMDSYVAPGPLTRKETHVAWEMTHNIHVPILGLRHDKYLVSFMKGERNLVEELFRLNTYYNTYYHDASAVQFNQEKKRIDEAVDLIKVIRQFGFQICYW